MDLTITLVLFVLAIALMVFFGWQGARPLDITRTQPRMVPWRLLMVLMSVVLITLLVHLLQLLGPLLR